MHNAPSDAEKHAAALGAWKAQTRLADNLQDLLTMHLVTACDDEPGKVVEIAQKIRERREM